MLPEAAQRHLRVLRLQPGDALALFDGGGSDWPAEVLAIGRHEVVVRVGARSRWRELPWPLVLAVGMPGQRAHGHAGREGH